MWSANIWQARFIRLGTSTAMIVDQADVLSSKHAPEERLSWQQKRQALWRPWWWNMCLWALHALLATTLLVLDCVTLSGLQKKGFPSEQYNTTEILVWRLLLHADICLTFEFANHCSELLHPDRLLQSDSLLQPLCSEKVASKAMLTTCHYLAHMCHLPSWTT